MNTLPENELSPNRSRGCRGLAPCAINRVTAYVESNIGERLSLRGLAKEACMSNFHFARMFRVSTGDSPMNYVLGRRIARAKELLAANDNRFSRIALDLGFCDHSHFTRIFRQETGMTPKQYVHSVQSVHSVHSVHSQPAQDFSLHRHL
ncbi:helix-turn-helix domain-containing protein [Undibacterium sp.]|uniref:helix-turn-helix domain-containing protein n=1 Tax=Undibacterium sp. TaxID=1914977 RepID=UPI00374D3AC3